MPSTCVRTRRIRNPHSRTARRVPPQGKLDTVLNYIREHPGCRSTEIIAHTTYPKTTLDRCLSDLKRQGLIEYRGSKKTGGYCVVGDSMESMAADASTGL